MLDLCSQADYNCNAVVNDLAIEYGLGGLKALLLSS